MVWRHTRRFGSGRETPKSTEVVERPSGRTGSCQETLREVRIWSGDQMGGSELVGTPSGILLVVGRPFRRSGSGRETLPQVRK